MSDAKFFHDPTTGRRAISLEYDAAIITDIGSHIKTEVIDRFADKILAEESESIMRNIDRSILRDQILRLVADRIVDRIFSACEVKK